LAQWSSTSCPRQPVGIDLRAVIDGQQRLT
jgi:hypothetical protein